MSTNLKSKLTTVFRILLAVTATVFPIAFAPKIEALNWVYLLIFGVLAGSVAILEIYLDRRTSDELEATRQQLEQERARLSTQKERLKLQEARGLAMARLLDLPKPVVLLLENQAILTTPQEKKAVFDRLHAANEQIMQMVCREVSAYYKESEEPKVDASLMLGVPISQIDLIEQTQMLPVDLKNRVQFREWGRDIASYRFVLDMILVSATSLVFGPIALPVEDAANAKGKRKLLPGAPSAFAQGRDQIIPDTSAIKSYAGPDLATDVLEDQVRYFESKGIRSMLCLVLRGAHDPIGVLNIQSDRIDLFRDDNESREFITGIAHYRDCFQYVMAGQRRLLGLAS